MTPSVGNISELWRFPVKSMQGETLQQVEMTALGVVGDRGYALIESDTGKVASAKSVRHFPDLLNCRAEFVEPPGASGVAPPVRITLPDGTTVTSGTDRTNEILSSYFGLAVTLERAAPEDFVIDQYHPEVEHVEPAGRLNQVVDQKLGSSLFAELGMESAVPVGALFDMFPASVMTTSTLDALRELCPDGRIDVRRFRMNVIVETEDSGFVENNWVGKSVAFGDGARLHVTLPDPRCVMTTLAQDDLPRDTAILRVMAEHNLLEIVPGVRYPCAGVYAAVVAPGTLRVGDPVSIS
jgi:uncharacterized protein YcbX